MYRLTIRIRFDDTIRPNTNTLFGALFVTEANTKRIFGTSLILTGGARWLIGYPSSSLPLRFLPSHPSVPLPSP